MDTHLLKVIKDTVFSHVDSKKYRVFIFGSRALETSTQFSDIDIGIESDSKISPLLLFELEEAFEESNLPYMVDIVDFTSVSDKFKQVAKKHTIRLN